MRSMMTSRGPALTTLAFVGMVSGCFGDPNQTKLQWMPDMADAPTVKAQESYLDPPEGSVAMGAHDYAPSPEDSEKVAQNPFPSTPQTVQKGKALFETFCIPCHGLDAKGHGTLHNLFPQPPDITDVAYAERRDGFFYYRITMGSALMPPYGHSTTSDERWMIVHYLRTLQRKG